MIRIERGPEVSPGMFEFSVASPRLFGKSHQPLLDACRELKRMGVDTATPCGLFRKGSTVADLTAILGVAAGLTVSEPASGHQFKFVKFKEYPVNARA